MIANEAKTHQIIHNAVLPLFAALALLGSLFLFAGVAHAQDDPATDYAIAVAIPIDETTEDAEQFTSVKEVVLNKKNCTIKNNGKIRLRATVIPETPGMQIKDETITWSISNSKIASVTQEGIVQGKKTGTATVTAQAANGKRATATIKVIVNKKKMAKAIPVLTYHRVSSNVASRLYYLHDSTNVSASLFDKQMRWLKSHGYNTISTQEFINWRKDGAFLPKKSVLLTIDDALYETYYFACPILAKYNLKATVFVIGSKTFEQTDVYNPFSRLNHYMGRRAINEVRRNYPNVEFQSHTYGMHQRTSNRLGVAKSWTRQQIDEDLKKNEGFGYIALAYPFGHYSKTMIAALKANKSIQIAFAYRSNKPATRTSPLYKIPRFKMSKFAGMTGFMSVLNTAR